MDAKRLPDAIARVADIKAGKKIMVVDDEPDVVNLIKMQLDQEDYQVLTAYDGLEALAKVVESRPDLVILDIMMPKVDGWVVCHSIKSNPATSHTKVLILSARSQIRARIKGLYILQADMYMTKPFDLDELSANVRRLLHIDQLAREALPAEARVGDGVDLTT